MKKRLAILLAVVMLVSLLPLSVFAATMKITTQPKTSYTAYNGTAKATVKASGDGLKYTWYFKNAGESAFKKSSITKATYSTTMTDTSKDRQVYCVVKDSAGKSVKSSTAILRMAASITTQPKTAYAQKSKTVSTAVKAKGDGLKYTWYIKNAGDSAFKKSSITKATYSTTMTDACKNRQVYCVVTDKYGKTDTSNKVYLRMTTTITTQPKTAYAQKSKTVSTTVKAVGEGLEYTWYIKNAGDSAFKKSSCTKATYSSIMTGGCKDRQVYCVVTDKYGKTDTSNKVYLRMAATITTQPKNVAVDEGATAKVTVKAVGDDLTYQWYLKNVGGEKFSKSSITKATYTATMSNKVNGRQVYCVVTDKYGKTAQSKTVTLSMNENFLAIKTQPKDITCNAGDEVAFSIVAKGGKAPYTYQWQYIYGSDLDWMAFPEDAIVVDGDMVFAVLSVNPMHFGFNFRARCIVTDADGTQIISNEAKLIEAEKPLTIDTQPEDVICKVGDEVSFSVTVIGGKAPYTYQWQCYCAGDGDSWWDIEADMSWAGGYNTPSLGIVVGPVDFADVTKYRCMITDADGNQVVSNEVKVVEDKPLTIITQPQDATGDVGDTVTFSVEASGAEPVKYYWYAKKGSVWWCISNEPWATGALTDTVTITVPDSSVTDGLYRCLIKDAKGNEVYTNEVKVVEPGPLTIVTQPTDVIGDVGDTVTYTIEVKGGKAPYRYCWKYENKVVGLWGADESSNTLTIQLTAENIQAKTFCTVIDAKGNQVTSNYVKVVKPNSLTIVTQPMNVTAKVGDEVNFLAEVEGGKAPYTYQWQFSYNSSGWVNIGGAHLWASGEQTERLSFAVDQDEYGQYKYRCVITDAEGNQVITDEAWVKEALRIVTQPQNVTANVGDNVSFSVAVSGGTEPYTYYWQCYHDRIGCWVPLSAVGDDTEQIRFKVSSKDEWRSNYKYRCIITDAEGNQVFSDAARVVDANALRITCQPVDVAVKVGSTAEFYIEVEGGTEPYSYQWQVSSGNNVWYNIKPSDAWASGQLTDTLSFKVDSDEYGNYEYRCVVTDADGNKCTSDVARVLEP